MIEYYLEQSKDILKNHVYPVFGNNQNIAAITRGDVKSFLLRKLNDGYATSTVAHLRNCLSGIFYLALDHEIIQANPALQLGKGLLQKKEQKEDINPLTSNELKILLSTINLVE